MTALSEREAIAVLDLVGEAHDAEDLDAFRAAVLPGLARVVPSDYASYNEIDGSGTAIATVTVPQLPSESVAAWERFAMQNPLLARHTTTRDGRAYRFSDVTTPAQLRRLDIYRHLYRPLGIEHQMAFTLPSGPELVIGIALNRTAADFSDHERRLVDLARPNLIQAYRNAELRERTAKVLDGVQRGL